MVLPHRKVAAPPHESLELGTRELQDRVFLPLISLPLSFSFFSAGQRLPPWFTGNLRAGWRKLGVTCV